MAKKQCVNTSIGSTCDDPLFVEMCNAIGIETALTEIGCIFSTDPLTPDVVIGKVLACKVTDEVTGVSTFKAVAMYEDGTTDQNYTGPWGECNPIRPSTLLLEGCIPDAANPGETELAVVGINGADGALLWGPIATSVYGFVSCCSEDVTACTQMVGFDYYALADYTAGQTTQFEVLVDGVSQAVMALDYNVETDGANKSSWYTQVVAAVNAVSGWTMTLVTDAAQTTNQRPVWQFDFVGVGPSTLVITEGTDVRTMAVDAAGVMTVSATDNGNPFGTDPFTACP